MKTVMVLLALVVWFPLFTVLAQERIDVIYLKNGDVLKGVIVENVPNDHVRIELSGGTTLTVKYSEILKFTKEKPTSPESKNDVTESPGQGKAQEVLSAGLKLGLNFSTFTGAPSGVNVSSTTGFVGGGFLTYKFADQVALQPELLISSKGAESNDGTNDVKITITYLEIPVSLKYYFETQGPAKPTIFVGLAPEVKMSADYTENGESQDASTYVNSFDMGLLFGGGLDYNLTNGKITFDLRYTVGLSTVDNTAMVGNLDLKNSAVALTIGYGF